MDFKNIGIINLFTTQHNKTFHEFWFFNNKKTYKNNCAANEENK